MCCETYQDETPEQRILHDFGFFGHYIYTNRGGRGGKQHVLKTLYFSGGEMSQKALLEKTSTTSAALSEVVGKLESEGLVERRRSEQDKRQLLVRLTPSGGLRAEEVIDGKRRFERDSLSCLDEGERAELLALLDRLRRHWEQLKEDEAKRGETPCSKN